MVPEHVRRFAVHPHKFVGRLSQVHLTWLSLLYINFYIRDFFTYVDENVV